MAFKNTSSYVSTHERVITFNETGSWVPAMPVPTDLSIPCTPVIGSPKGQRGSRGPQKLGESFIAYQTRLHNSREKLALRKREKTVIRRAALLASAEHLQAQKLEAIQVYDLTRDQVRKDYGLNLKADDALTLTEAAMRGLGTVDVDKVKEHVVFDTETGDHFIRDTRLGYTLIDGKGKKHKVSLKSGVSLVEEISSKIKPGKPMNAKREPAWASAETKKHDAAMAVLYAFYHADTSWVSSKSSPLKTTGYGFTPCRLQGRVIGFGISEALEEKTNGNAGVTYVGPPLAPVVEIEVDDTTQAKRDFDAYVLRASKRPINRAYAAPTVKPYVPVKPRFVVDTMGDIAVQKRGADLLIPRRPAPRFDIVRKADGSIKSRSGWYCPLLPISADGGRYTPVIVR